MNVIPLTINGFLERQRPNNIQLHRDSVVSSKGKTPDDCLECVAKMVGMKVSTGRLNDSTILVYLTYGPQMMTNFNNIVQDFLHFS
jgi:hypothetical protein